MDRLRVAVIGGGPAGIAAAYATGLSGASAVIFERNEKLGKKLYISGKGRCNITNDCPVPEFLTNVVRGEKFLFSALNLFSPADTVELVEKFGCPLKTERGGRVFPLSDKSSDVLKAFSKALIAAGAEIRLDRFVGGGDIVRSGEGFLVFGERFDRIVYAGGGVSYPATGSTGEGFAFARSLGHEIIPLKPALINIDLHENVKGLMGLSLKNAELSAYAEGKKIYSGFGEMLFTDTGISGPLVLSLSSRINRTDSPVSLSLDLKPALSFETLSERIRRDFSGQAGRMFKNCLSELLPASLIPYIISVSGFDPAFNVSHFSVAMYAKLTDLLKGLPFSVRAIGGIERAVVTSGGVSLKEINPKTMESKLAAGVYFAGEMLDIDALTGGFNIQIALSTGYAAGLAAAKK